jgi:hypothetical protein
LWVSRIILLWVSGIRVWWVGLRRDEH